MLSGVFKCHLVCRGVLARREMTARAHGECHVQLSLTRIAVGGFYSLVRSLGVSRASVSWSCRLTYIVSFASIVAAQRFGYNAGDIYKIFSRTST